MSVKKVKTNSIKKKRNDLERNKTTNSRQTTIKTEMANSTQTALDLIVKGFRTIKYITK